MEYEMVNRLFDKIAGFLILGLIQKFLDFDTVALSFLFNKHYPILE